MNHDRGYSFNAGNAPSREYVRFYLSNDRGLTWHDEGLTAVSVCDDPGAKPRIHLVTKRMNLRQDGVAQAHLVRAILSWTSPPPPRTPDWTPLWGNVVETPLQTVKDDARRTDSLQTTSWEEFANDNASE